MKKLVFTAALMLIFLVNSFAQSVSSVVVFSQEGEKFWVIINGIKQNDKPQTNVKVTNLTAPNYKFKIIFENDQIPSLDQNIMTKNADNQYCDMTYVVKKNPKGAYVMRINSFEVAKGNTASTDPNQYNTPLSLQDKQPTNTTQTQTQTQTPNTNNTTTTQTTTVNQNTTTDPNGANVSISVVDPTTGKPVNMNVGVSATGTQTQTQANGSTTITTTTVTTTNQTTDPNLRQTNTNTVNQTQPVNNTPVQPTHYVMQGYNGPIGCPWPMSDADFNSAKQSISTKSFEEDKLTIAKQVLGSNCMTCDQIKGVMGVFSFEDSKLDFAKYAYGYVYDPGNFYKVNDAFTFSSSIDELNEYIKANKKY